MSVFPQKVNSWAVRYPIKQVDRGSGCTEPGLPGDVKRTLLFDHSLIILQESRRHGVVAGLLMLVSIVVNSSIGPADDT
ncbi:MAG: hypothetical protein CME36_09940 [unclassified Hahellaceae]|nr:hypothetical protein [Hahellaceae bacterium]